MSSKIKVRVTNSNFYLRTIWGIEEDQVLKCRSVDTFKRPEGNKTGYFVETKKDDWIVLYDHEVEEVE